MRYYFEDIMILVLCCYGRKILGSKSDRDTSSSNGDICEGKHLRTFTDEFSMDTKSKMRLGSVDLVEVQEQGCYPENIDKINLALKKKDELENPKWDKDLVQVWKNKINEKDH
jgi:hypothetical protein